MQAAVIEKLGSIGVQDVKKPSCGSNDILIKVMVCGMCGSDSRILNHGNFRVKLPAIIGHEIAGVIAETGKNVKKFKTGDRVSMGADVPCGECGYCTLGSCNNCEVNLAIGYQYPGGYAEYIKVDKRVWDIGPFQKISKNISFEEAALAEPLACAINGLEILPGRQKDSILIIGSGVLGCLFIQLAKVFGYKKVFLSDIDEKKMSMVKKLNFKVDKYIKFDPGMRNTIMGLTGERGVNSVIVACASVEAQRMALHLAAKRGSVNLFAGLPKNAEDISFPSNLVHYNEIFLTGSHGSTPIQHKRALRLITGGKVNVKKLITHRYPLDKIGEAFKTAGGPSRLKVVVYPNKQT